MRRFTARVVEIIHMERLVDFEVDELCAHDEILEAAERAACDQDTPATMIGVMSRPIHDLKEVK